MKSLPTMLALAMLGLCACSQEVPGGPAPTRTPVEQPPAPAAEGERLPADAFGVALGEVDCSGPVAVARVRWDAGDLAADGVAIHVESPGNPRKLWVEGGASGEEATGKWVFAGSRFSLYNRVSGELLAQRGIDALPCAGQ